MQFQQHRLLTLLDIQYSLRASLQHTSLSTHTLQDFFATHDELHSFHMRVSRLLAYATILTSDATRDSIYNNTYSLTRFCQNNMATGFATSSMVDRPLNKPYQPRSSTKMFSKKDRVFSGVVFERWSWLVTL